MPNIETQEQITLDQVIELLDAQSLDEVLDLTNLWNYLDFQEDKARYEAILCEAVSSLKIPSFSKAKRLTKEEFLQIIKDEIGSIFERYSD